MSTTRQRSKWEAAAVGAAMLLGAAGVSNVGAQQPTQSEGVMSIEHNKTAALRWSQELWSQGNLATADEIIAPDYVRHDPGDPFPAQGPDDVKRIVTMLRAMLPDFRIDVETLVAEGDLVVSRYTATATDTVGYMGMPADGKGDTHVRLFRCSAFRTGRSSKAGRRGMIWYLAAAGTSGGAGWWHQPLIAVHTGRGSRDAPRELEGSCVAQATAGIALYLADGRSQRSTLSLVSSSVSSRPLRRLSSPRVAPPRACWRSSGSPRGTQTQ